MEADIQIIKVDEVHVKVLANPGIKMELSDAFTFMVPGYQHMPLYRNKQWDGKIRLLNLMNGVIYLGLTWEVAEVAKKLGYTVSIDPALEITNDIPETIAHDIAKKHNLPSNKTPRDYQEKVVYEALKHNRRLILSPTSSGKSLVAYLMTRYYTDKNLRTLIIVPTIMLVNQMAGDFVEYNNNQPMDIYKIKGGVDKEKITSSITVSTWQSIYKMPKKWFEQFNVVICDEAHQYKSKSMTEIMEKCSRIRYKIGMTGTLDNFQTNQLVLKGIFGPVVKMVTTQQLIERGTLASFDIRILNLQYPEAQRKVMAGAEYQPEIKWLVENRARNRYITNLAKSLDGNVLLMFNFIEHGEEFMRLLEGCGKKLHFIHGGVDGDKREAIRKEIENTTGNIAVGSNGTMSTGVNIVNLDYLILGSPSKSKIRNLQTIGRVLRKGGSKTKARMFDIGDNLTWRKKPNYAQLHLNERIKLYAQEGFEYKIYNVEISDETNLLKDD